MFEFVFTCKNCKNKNEQSISDRGWYFRKLHKQKTLKKQEQKLETSGQEIVLLSVILFYF